MKIVVLMLSLLATSSAHAISLAGQEVPPYPKGFDSRMGSCLTVNAEQCAFAISVLENARGVAVGVLAKRLVRYKGNEAIWRVVDQVESPPMADTHDWAMEECRRDGRVDPTIVAIVTTGPGREEAAAAEQGEEVLATVWAMRFDIKAGRLRPLDPASVKCILPGT